MAENLSILAMIPTYPRRLDALAWFSSLIKILKFGSCAVGLPILEILPII